ncbi:hypothetical protein RN001_001873 [Aquatica leii]|uniref:Mutator-like transposase domain-containing protein n=1 Tax=Aquatica leii TaxID=1421715 RepID=A0AAN7SJT6_9COLE|nr:hypothetical protein RN001_001873 [Aquatica leii]
MFYRLPQDIYQVAKVSKILQLMEKGNIAQFKNKCLEEIDIDMESVEEDQDMDENTLATCQNEPEDNINESNRSDPISNNVADNIISEIIDNITLTKVSDNVVNSTELHYDTRESEPENQSLHSIYTSNNESNSFLVESEDENNHLYCELDVSTEILFLVTGRRIVNISYFFEQLISIRHEGFDCSFYDLNIISEKFEGLQSVFSFKCSVCNKIETIRNDITENKMNTNLGVVAGAIATGVGYSQVSELFASMDVPNMSNKTYSKYHSKISLAITKNINQLMTEAGKEETKLAIELGDVNADGVPVISVIVDGAWSKRSYRTNYSALSGVGCIIGARTKEILYMDVKNKYCYVCSRSKRSKKHDCYKNWNHTSTAMEAMIIAEGFQKSVATHNLIYGRVIGDGDSSVYKKLTALAPYGPTFIIEKIECRNHLLRNYLNKLAEILKNSTFPISQRKKITNINTLGRFRNAITKAIQYRKQETQPFASKASSLQNDIKNSPNHIFGDHSSCDSYFCTKNTETEENLVPELKSSGLFDLIKKINLRLAYNATSLLHDIDTNAVETYNSIVAKFVGGKRINFSLKGSYETRCKAAAISYNTNGDFLSTMHMYFNGKIGSYLQTFSNIRKKLTNVSKSRKQIKRKAFATTDTHYGPEASTLMDMTVEETWYKHSSIIHLENSISKPTKNKRKHLVPILDTSHSTIVYQKPGGKAQLYNSCKLVALQLTCKI